MMIQLTSFYPFANFRRITQEFHDDKIAVTDKLSTAEYQCEFKYTDIAIIEHRRYANSAQAVLGIQIVVMISLLSWLRIYNSPIVRYIGLTLFSLGALIHLLGFVKRDHCYLLDEYQGYLTSFQLKPNNVESIEAALELIRNKSSYKDELDPDDSFPNAEPIFERADYDIPAMFNKTVARYYETELLETEKSWTAEVATKIRYSELSPKVVRGKQGNSNWSSLGWHIVFYMVAITQFPGSQNFTYPPPGKTVFYFLASLSVFAFILSFIKEDVVFFYNKRDEIVYWMKISRANREKDEEIIRFIQSKIPTEKTEAPIERQ